MAHHIQLPQILLSITSNPVTAVGLPVLVGMLSGLPTRKVVRGRWYNVCPVDLYPMNTNMSSDP
jgi:benzodiazapine receptor